MTNSTEMLVNLAGIAIQANVPILITGDPGLAKTDMVNGIGRSLGWPCVTKIASQHDPTDFIGLPWMGEHGFVELKPFKWAHDLSQEVIGDKRALLILDEINMAQQATLNSVMRLIHEGMVGDVKLGSGVTRVAMCNPPEIANVPVMLPSLSNRFFHINPWDMSIEYWVQATIQGYPDPYVTPLPENWREYIPQTRAMIASFVTASGKAHDRPKDESKWGNAWASFRTITMSATLLAAAQALNAGDGVETALMEGCVGAGMALEFMEYRRKLNLPHPKDVLANPAKTKYPQKGDQLYALLNSVVSYTLANDTAKLWVPCWEVLVKASEIKMDVAAASAKALAAGSIDANRQFKWVAPKCAMKFYDVLNMAGIAHQKKTTAA